MWKFFLFLKTKMERPFYRIEVPAHGMGAWDHPARAVLRNLNKKNLTPRKKKSKIENYNSEMTVMPSTFPLPPARRAMKTWLRGGREDRVTGDPARVTRLTDWLPRLTFQILSNFFFSLSFFFQKYSNGGRKKKIIKKKKKKKRRKCEKICVVGSIPWAKSFSRSIRRYHGGDLLPH